MPPVRSTRSADAVARASALTEKFRQLEMVRRYRIGLGVSEVTRLGAGDDWLVRVVRLVRAGQLTAANEAIAYANAYVSALGGVPASLDGLSQGVGTGYGNNPVGETFRRIQRQADQVLARDGSEASRRFLERKATRTAADLTWLAARDTLQQAVISHPSLTGYRRIASPLACGACLALATGLTLPPDTAFLDHPHCRCTIEPVVKGAPTVSRRNGQRLFEEMTEAEQNRHFGLEKAELLRSGDIKLEDLVSKPKGHIGRRKLITETPLRDLEASIAA